MRRMVSMQRLFAGLAAVALSAIPAACGTIPLSTAARFTTFDEKDFASLDPRDLRVRVAVPRGYSWDVASVKLGVQVDAGGRERSQDFQLAGVGEEPGRRGDGIVSSGVPVVVTTLRLADPSTTRFRELQRFVADAKTDRIHLDVMLSMLAAPAGAKSVRVWIEAMLSPRQGYFTLVDGGTIRLNATQAYGTHGR